MTASVIKAFTTKLSAERRHALKFQVLMASSDTLSRSRRLFQLSCKNSMSEDVVIAMDELVTHTQQTCLSRCRKMCKTWNEKRYVASLVKRYVLAPMRYTFEQHLGRLSRKSILNTLNCTWNCDDRTSITQRIKIFETKQQTIEKSLSSQVLM